MAASLIGFTKVGRLVHDQSFLCGANRAKEYQAMDQVMNRFLSVLYQNCLGPNKDAVRIPNRSLKDGGEALGFPVLCMG